MAELPRRHMPATLRLKELIATRLGEPQLLFCHLRQGAGEHLDLSPRNQAVTPETQGAGLNETLVEEVAFPGVVQRSRTTQSQLKLRPGEPIIES